MSSRRAPTYSAASVQIQRAPSPSTRTGRKTASPAPGRLARPAGAPSLDSRAGPSAAPALLGLPHSRSPPPTGLTPPAARHSGAPAGLRPTSGRRGSRRAGSGGTRTTGAPTPLDHTPASPGGAAHSGPGRAAYRSDNTLGPGAAPGPACASSTGARRPATRVRRPARGSAPPALTRLPGCRGAPAPSSRVRFLTPPGRLR
jgi:hypothetical protein